MGCDLIGTNDADEPDSSIDWNRLNASSCTPAGSAVMPHAGGRSEHSFEKVEALEAMRYGIMHESMKRNGWVGEIHEELKAFGIVISDSNGDPEGSFSTVTFALSIQMIWGGAEDVEP